MVDLHLHTTASDGHLAPQDLVAQAAAAGLTTIAVTDHDTAAATSVVAAACAAHGLTAIAGIEITAIEHGRDVHVLGYFFDPTHEGLLAFLAAQRRQRVERVTAIAARLASLGMPIDPAPLLAEADGFSGRSIGRPQVARAMVAAGHVTSVRDAFDNWLGNGLPAFVPRAGTPVADVIGAIHAAGGLASIAHPVQSGIDEQIPRLRDAGLDAIEVYHSDHGPAERERYLEMATRLDLLVTGGSDFHADPEHGIALGAVSLPEEHWERLKVQGTRAKVRGT